MSRIKAIEGLSTTDSFLIAVDKAYFHCSTRLKKGYFLFPISIVTIAPYMPLLLYLIFLPDIYHYRLKPFFTASCSNAPFSLDSQIYKRPSRLICLPYSINISLRFPEIFSIWWKIFEKIAVMVTGLSRRLKIFLVDLALMCTLYS